MGILKKLFIFTLFLFPLGEIARLNFGSGFIIKPLDIAVVILVFLWFVFKILKKQKIKQTNILIPLALFIPSGLVSLITNNLRLSQGELFISFSYLLRWLAYAGIFFVVRDFDRNFRRKISSALIILGFLIVGVGYLQYFFYPSLKGLYHLGWDEHMYRMFSVFLDPNFAGVFFVLFFLFLIGLFIRGKNILKGMLLAFTLGAIFLTFSRSALIMLIVSSSVLFVLINKKIWIAILFGITLLILVISSRYFNIENINLFRIVSSEARLKTAEKAIGIIQNHLLFGTGFNAYRYAKLDNSSRNDKSKTTSHADAAPDNSFLFVLATTGIVGFSVYFLLWWKIIRKAWINYKDKRAYASLFLASVAGLFVNALFINSLFYPPIMLWMWVLAGLMDYK